MSNVDNVSATGQYYGDGGHERNLSNIDNSNLEEISQGGFDKHNRNPSFLTKDFSISRHERQKSAMIMESEPNEIGGL